MNKRIILIENQFQEFSIIREHLVNHEFDVFPHQKSQEDDKEFNQLMDLIRVFLNKREGGLEDNSRRMIAFKQLLMILASYTPDLIILDYLLFGSHKAEQATFLAEKLRKNGVDQPIIFLSRLDSDSPEVVEIQAIAEPKIWIKKVDSGSRFMDKSDFEDSLLKEILKLIRIDEFEPIKRKIIEIKKWKMFDDEDDLKYQVKNALEKILELGHVSEIQKKAILNFHALANNDEIKNFLLNIQ